MTNWIDLSINARIALCLLCTEAMIPRLEEIMEKYPDYKNYPKGKQQINEILDFAWNNLQKKEHVDWSQMYSLCNEGYGWTDDVKFGGYGYFDFVLHLNCNNSDDEILISNSFIYCYYYAMYHYAKRQKEKHLPQDMEWFEMEGSEEEMFLYIDNAINLFISSLEQEKIQVLKRELYKYHCFSESNPYGKYLKKEEALMMYNSI